MIDPLINQTAFSGEEPLLQKDSTQARKLSLESSSSRQIIALSVMIVMLSVISIGGFLLLRPQGPDLIGNLVPTPTPAEVKTVSELDAMFTELSDELLEADPSEQILPFPPIDKEIQISDE